MVYEPQYVSIALLLLLILYPIVLFIKLRSWKENTQITKVFHLISPVFYILTVIYMIQTGLLSDTNEMLFGSIGFFEMIILTWSYIFLCIHNEKK